MTIEAMKQALEALEDPIAFAKGHAAKAALRTAIEAAEKQEPVAWTSGIPPLYPEMKDGETISAEYVEATPPAAQRQQLTDEQIMQTWEGIIKYAPGDVRLRDFARAIEAAHGIGEKK